MVEYSQSSPWRQAESFSKPRRRSGGPNSGVSPAFRAGGAPSGPNPSANLAGHWKDWSKSFEIMAVSAGAESSVLKGEMKAIDPVVARAVHALGHSPSAIVTDIDGTISPIVPRPEDAFVLPGASEALRRLARRLSLVAVVTAREVAVARRMVGVEQLTYVGNYGLSQSQAAADKAPFDTAVIALQPLLTRFPCITLEHKGAGLAIHYRNCADRPAVRAQALRLCEPFVSRGELRVQEGKQVVELVPAWLPDKGTAVAALLAQHGIRGVVYLGDDLSDIAVFRELARRRDAGELASLCIGVIDAETDPAVAAS